MKIPRCNWCGRLLRSPQTRWIRGDTLKNKYLTTLCLACLKNPNWGYKVSELDMYVKDIRVSEEWKLFSDNQFEGEKLLRKYGGLDE